MNRAELTILTFKPGEAHGVQRLCESFRIYLCCRNITDLKQVIFDNFSNLAVLNVHILAWGVMNGVIGRLNGGLIIRKQVDIWSIAADKSGP